MRATLVSIVAAFLSVGVFAEEPAAAVLDGTYWEMHFQPSKTILPFWKPATMRFDNGQFRSDDFVDYGFLPSSYDAKRLEAAVLWSSTMTTAKGDKTQWVGTWTGNRMEGTFMWIRPNGKVRQYRWEAKIHAAPETTAAN
jgi:hypothetical protein